MEELKLWPKSIHNKYLECLNRAMTAGVWTDAMKHLDRPPLFFISNKEAACIVLHLLTIYDLSTEDTSPTIVIKDS